MILIFFQSCLSPHQMPYIRECIKFKVIEKIYYIIPRIDYTDRIAMGWDNDGLLKEVSVSCLVMPKYEELKSIIQSGNDVRCFFSGIRADADIYRWFKQSLSYSVKRYLITEPPYTFNKPLWMHFLRFLLQDYKYVKYIDGVFAIGESCKRYYENISKNWKVWPFVYVTEKTNIVGNKPEGKLKVLYVGRLSKRKNVKVLVEAMEGLVDIELTIVGDGEEREMLELLSAKKNVTAHFIGTRSMSEIPEIISKHDVLVLPSLHDGWGAVINEALTQGLYAVCSDKCGSKDLLHNPKLGSVFHNNDSSALRYILRNAASNIEMLRSERNFRKTWMAKNVDGVSVANYFVKCLTDEGNVTCPWK